MEWEWGVFQLGLFKRLRVCLPNVWPEFTLPTARTHLSSHTDVWPDPQLSSYFGKGFLLRNNARTVEFHFRRGQELWVCQQHTLSSEQLPCLSFLFSMKTEVWDWMVSTVQQRWHKYHCSPCLKISSTVRLSTCTTDTVRHSFGAASWFSLMNSKHSSRTFSRKMWQKSGT